MDNIVLSSVILTVALIGLGLVAILAFGLRSIAWGKVQLSKVLFMAVPFVLMVVMGFVLDDWARAALYTLMLMLAGSLVAMLLSSVRGIFN